MSVEIVILCVARWRWRAAHLARLTRLAGELGGWRAEGRLSGRVEVAVEADGGAAAAVCLCRDTSAVYWWRLGSDNGHALAGRLSPARAAAAAVRVWGGMWASGAESVTIHIPGLAGDTEQARLSEQVIKLACLLIYNCILCIRQKIIVIIRFCRLIAVYTD